MAEVKEIPRPFKYWPMGGGYKIKLSNKEIEEVVAAASPAAALTGFIPIPYVGPAIAVVIAAYMYWIKQQNKKDGGRGVVIEIHQGIAGGWSPVVMSIDTW